MKRVFRQIRNVKWELMLHMLTAALIVSAAAGFFIWFWFYVLNGMIGLFGLWLAIADAALFVGLSVGYVAALRFQRKLNRLHLGILQLGRGNLAERIPVTGDDAFDKIYYDFNEMAAGVEQRIQMLKKLGEEHVRQRASFEEAAVLEERKRLARDLHDTVSQQLFALHMSASTLEKIIERDAEKAKMLAAQITQVSATAQRQIRGLIAQLRPVELEGRSLEEALGEWFPDYCRHNRLLGELDIRLSGPMSDALEHQIFMIVQEAMANVVKHAEASRAELSLHEQDHQYVLTVADDGRGFYNGQVQTHSYGLSSMQERARELGGRTEIYSKAGSGTRIKVYFPKFKTDGKAEDQAESRTEGDNLA